MLTILGPGQRYCDGISRRSFLRIGGLGFGGLSLPHILRAEAASGIRQPHKAVIMVILPGGPPHLDMYDLKPDAPAEIRGEFKPIKTKVPGIEISELMPRMAAMMDKFAIVRTLVGGLDEHNIHPVLTGWESHPPQGDSQNVPGYPPGGWPSYGSVVSKVLGPKTSGIPAYVTLSPQRTEDASRASLYQPGFFGMVHAGFEAYRMDTGDIQLKGISLDRLADRRSLLASFDNFRREVDPNGRSDDMDALTKQALGMIASSKIADALNLDREPLAIRQRYGIPDAPVPVKYGGKHLEQFLMARRLIEAGVRCVTLAFCAWPLGVESKGGGLNWDFHAALFQKAGLCVPMFEQGLTALVEDLQQRGMLDDVSIIAWGEFGRTPRINKDAGRDHWPNNNACVLAGGGMRTGQVVGTTNRYGEYPIARPVHYREVFATLYHNLGIDPKKLTFLDSKNRPHKLIDDRDPLPELI